MPRLTRNQIEQHCAEVARADRAFRAVIRDAELCPIGRVRPKTSHFESLVRSVTAQQVSTAAARSIYSRVIDACGGEVTPESVARSKVAHLRAAGLSAAKTRTVTALATAATTGSIDFSTLPRKADETVINELIVIPGIGRWTAEMFLMFQLGRLDVWPVGDLAVRRGWDNMHPGQTPVTPARLHQLGEPFSGRRSVAAWYCWRAS